MKKVIFLVWILTLAACSGKKTTPVSEIEDQDLSDVHLTELHDIDDDDDHDDYYDDDYVYSSQEGEYYERSWDYNNKPVVVSGGITATASSELADSRGAYPAHNLVDHTWRSWAEASSGNGVGESFTLTMYSTETITGFALKNGYGNINYYSENNRVKSFRIYVDGNYLETIPVKDSISFEQYYFEEPVVEFKTIQFVIDDVYPGTSYNDTCVAEIALLKQNFSDRVFYDNILFWLSTHDSNTYAGNNREILSIADTDGIRLLDYLPFELLVFEELKYFYYRYDPATGQYHQPETRIALLDRPSSLRLNNNLPRLDGATAMYPLYSSFVHAVYPEANIDKVSESSFLASLYQSDYFPNERLFLYHFGELYHPYSIEFGSIVQCNTTSRAFQRLIDGEVDIIFCYAPSQEEIATAAQKGLSFYLTSIAKDAFIFIVNDKNILNNITQRQIRNIYSGRVTNWSSISGVDDPIIAYQRPANSGSQTTLQAIMERDRLASPLLEGEITGGGMSIMIRKVASNYYNYNSAIGYTFLFYLTQMVDNSGIKILSIDGVMPTRQTIQNNRYPFTQTVYAITTGNESDNTRRFITWILSAQGQELVAKTGYTPVR